MKPTFFILTFSSLLLASGTGNAQKPLAPLPPVREEAPATAPVASTVPPEVVASASAAVAKLGDEVVLGRYQVAVDRMNPMWKERTAKRMGGMEELNKQLAGVAKQMVQQGISMISFKPVGLPRAYEVSPGKKVEKVNGVETESLVFNKWLVLVPTTTKFRIMQKLENQAPKAYTIDSIGFQVAISEKGKNDWTFIDGAGISVNDLRSMFATLPQDMTLPPLEKKESR
ncbi:MAG: hypothetical protein ABIT37_24710 [Luteolibacter sp.]